MCSLEESKGMRLMKVLKSLIDENSYSFRHMFN